MNQILDKAVKIILAFLLLSALTIVLIFLNIGNDFGKMVESGQLQRVSGEGLGLLGLFLFGYVAYLLLFMCWLGALIIAKDRLTIGSKQIQLILIVIFSVLPTTVVLFVMFKKSPNPFSEYRQRDGCDIENGKVTRYSSDKVMVYEATILNNQMVGKEITRYDNGVIASENNYIQNVLHGESTVYDQNGNKRSITTYIMGQKSRFCEFYGNRQMSYLFDEDSVYSKYEWWETGQLKSIGQQEPSEYRETNGNQTLLKDNIVIPGKTSGGKQQKTIYVNPNVIKEISWYSDGTVSRIKTIVTLPEKESRNIGYEEGAFSGDIDLYYFSNGMIRQIDYNANTGKNTRFHKSSRYGPDGKLLPD